MPYLLDSNVLIRLLNPADPQHALVRGAVRLLRNDGEQLSFTSQNLVEFWSVCTRPASARGGYGLTVAQTDRKARWLERLFTLVPDSPARDNSHPSHRLLLLTLAAGREPKSPERVRQEPVSRNQAELAAVPVNQLQQVLHVHRLW
jgi:hypothetical protein